MIASHRPYIVYYYYSEDIIFQRIVLPVIFTVVRSCSGVVVSSKCIFTVFCSLVLSRGAGTPDALDSGAGSHYVGAADSLGAPDPGAAVRSPGAR